MRTLTSLAAAILGLSLLVPSAGAYEAVNGPLGLLSYERGKTYDGYTLFTPHTKSVRGLWTRRKTPAAR